MDSSSIKVNSTAVEVGARTLMYNAQICLDLTEPSARTLETLEGEIFQLSSLVSSIHSTAASFQTVLHAVESTKDLETCLGVVKKEFSSTPDDLLAVRNMQVPDDVKLDALKVASGKALGQAYQSLFQQIYNLSTVFIALVGAIHENAPVIEPESVSGMHVANHKPILTEEDYVTELRKQTLGAIAAKRVKLSDEHIQKVLEMCGRYGHEPIDMTEVTNEEEPTSEA